MIDRLKKYLIKDFYVTMTKKRISLIIGLILLCSLPMFVLLTLSFLIYFIFDFAIPVSIFRPFFLLSSGSLCILSILYLKRKRPELIEENKKVLNELKRKGINIDV